MLSIPLELSNPAPFPLKFQFNLCPFLELQEEEEAFKQYHERRYSTLHSPQFKCGKDYETLNTIRNNISRLVSCPTLNGLGHVLFVVYGLAELS